MDQFVTFFEVGMSLPALYELAYFLSLSFLFRFFVRRRRLLKSLMLRVALNIEGDPSSRRYLSIRTALKDVTKSNDDSVDAIITL